MQFGQRSNNIGPGLVQETLKDHVQISEILYALKEGHYT